MNRIFRYTCNVYTGKNVYVTFSMYRRNSCELGYSWLEVFESVFYFPTVFFSRHHSSLCSWRACRKAENFLPLTPLPLLNCLDLRAIYKLR